MSKTMEIAEAFGQIIKVISDMDKKKTFEKSNLEQFSFIGDEKPNFNFLRANYVEIESETKSPLRIDNEVDLGMKSIIKVLGNINGTNVELCHAEITLVRVMIQPHGSFALAATRTLRKNGLDFEFTKTVAGDPADAFRYLACDVLNSYPDQLKSIETTFLGCFKMITRPTKTKINDYDWPIEDIFSLLEQVNTVYSGVESASDDDFHIALRHCDRSSTEIQFVCMKNLEVKVIFPSKHRYCFILKGLTGIDFVTSFCNLLKRGSPSKKQPIVAVVENGERIQDNATTDFCVNRKKKSSPPNCRFFYDMFLKNQGLTFIH